MAGFLFFILIDFKMEGNKSKEVKYFSNLQIIFLVEHQNWCLSAVFLKFTCLVKKICPLCSCANKGEHLHTNPHLRNSIFYILCITGNKFACWTSEMAFVSSVPEIYIISQNICPQCYCAN